MSVTAATAEPLIVSVSGLRGVVGQTLTPDVAVRYAAAFVAGLLFRGVASAAAIAGVCWGVALYATYTFVWQPAGIVTLHYIDFMVIVLASSVLAALAFNRFVLGARAEFTGLAAFRENAA